MVPIVAAIAPSVKDVELAPTSPDVVRGGRRTRLRAFALTQGVVTLS